MELAEAGQIGTLIVKDHSRLGRNRLVVGQLLEEEFDRLGVRYIAILDNREYTFPKKIGKSSRTLILLSLTEKPLPS